jgi:hypothetical protein
MQEFGQENANSFVFCAAKPFGAKKSALLMQIFSFSFFGVLGSTARRGMIPYFAIGGILFDVIYWITD